LRVGLNAFVIAALLLVSTPAATVARAAAPSSCTVENGTLVTGRIGDAVPRFVRVSSASGRHREILSLPHVQSGMIVTQSLLPFGAGNSAPATLTCSAASNAIDASGNVSLTGQPCSYRHFTVVDNGPRAIFAAAARNENTAAVRVQIVQEKFFASGVVSINALVRFSVDGGPQIAVPAQGTEPVAITADFPDLPPGPHHIAITVYGAYGDGGASQGVVCL